MVNNTNKKAVEMLLHGATLVSEPCPYCKGVRVIKDGTALCINCGKKPTKGNKKDSKKRSKLKPNEKSSSVSRDIFEKLEKKLKTLSEELERESDHKKQQEILKSINSLVEILGKMKKK